jgi:hypothetical protein
MARHRPERERPGIELGGPGASPTSPQTYALRAPAFEGIAEVEFSSDPRLDGVPFAAFSAILIEQIALVPFE